VGAWALGKIRCESDAATLSVSVSFVAGVSSKESMLRMDESIEAKSSAAKSTAAWGLLDTIPNRRWIGKTMAIYGICVAIASVYGRYHYAADAAGGIAVSFLGLAALKIADYRNSRGA
jgi:hypothetical protein